MADRRLLYAAVAARGLSIGLVGVLLHPAMASATGSVYVSYAADGVPSYASQRLDPSYRLLIRGEPGTVLSDVWYVVVGDDDTQLPPAQNGYVEFAVNLTGAVIPASGYLVVAEATFTLAPANVTTTLIFEDNTNVTHLLVSGFSGAVSLTSFSSMMSIAS